MPVQLHNEIIHLQGNCSVEDAEVLSGLLQDGNCRSVELGGAEGLHTAVVQLLLAWRPAIAGEPEEPFLSRWLLPLIKAAAGDAA